MPVKPVFGDRDSRINFERTLRECCGMRAVQSLPEPLRKEQTSFRNALLSRYPGDVVSVRLDAVSASFTAFKKKDGEMRWIPCWEKHKIPTGIMLPGDCNSRVVLPSEMGDPDCVGVTQDSDRGDAATPGRCRPEVEARCRYPEWYLPSQRGILRFVFA
jgi:hypothetical protein